MRYDFYTCKHQGHGAHPCVHGCNTPPDVLLKQAERTIMNARGLVLEMRRLLMKHAPMADQEVFDALARSYELVGD